MRGRRTNIYWAHTMARHHQRHFISFNLSRNPLNNYWNLFCRWGNKNSEGLSPLSKTTQVVYSRAGIWTQVQTQNTRAIKNTDIRSLIAWAIGLYQYHVMLGSLFSLKAGASSSGMHDHNSPYLGDIVMNHLTCYKRMCAMHVVLSLTPRSRSVQFTSCTAVVAARSLC